MLPNFKPPYKWAMSDDGKELLGMAQRFGPYSFVVNTDKISRKTAEEQGWDLFNDPKGRYGVQESDDWNVFDVFLVAGINPFKEHSDDEMNTFKDTAIKIFKGAKMVGGMATLNRGLISGEIDLYLTRGTYSVSPARAGGYPQMRSITPLKGPIDGKGGVAWIEITSTVNNPDRSPLAGILEVRPGAEGCPHGRLHRRHLQSRDADGQSRVLRAVHQGGARCHPMGQPGGRNVPLRGIRYRARLHQGARFYDFGQADAQLSG